MEAVPDELIKQMCQKIMSLISTQLKSLPQLSSPIALLNQMNKTGDEATKDPFNGSTDYNEQLDIISNKVFSYHPLQSEFSSKPEWMALQSMFSLFHPTRVAKINVDAVKDYSIPVLIDLNDQKDIKILMSDLMTDVVEGENQKLREEHNIIVEKEKERRQIFNREMNRMMNQQMDFEKF